MKTDMKLARTLPDAAFSLILALLMMSLSGSFGSAAIIAVLFASTFFAWRVLFGGPLLEPASAAPWLMLPLAVAVMVYVARPVYAAFGVVPTAFAALFVGMVAILASRLGSFALQIASVALLTGAVLAAGLLVTQSTDAEVIDIYVAHEGAAELLGQGRNPYTDLTFPNSSAWVEEGSTIEGYPYPGITMVVFSIGAWTVGAEVLGVLLLSATVFVLSWPLVRSPFAAAGVAAGGLLLASPAFWFMAFSSATESLSALLFAISAVLWRRKPMLAAAMFGVAIASKQYLLIPGMAIMMVPSVDRWRRTIVAGVSAVAVSLPFFLWNPGAYAWIYGGALGQSLRPDAISVGALDVQVPPLVAVGIALIAMYAVANHSRMPDGVFWTGTVGLAVALVLAPHSLVNHWYLLTSLIAAALVAGWLDVEVSDDNMMVGTGSSTSHAATVERQSTEGSPYPR